MLGQPLEDVLRAVDRGGGRRSGQSRVEAIRAGLRNSAQHLADHFEDYPLDAVRFLPGAIRRGSSIFPAIWNAQLAGAEAEGVGFGPNERLIANGRDPRRPWRTVRRGLGHELAFTFGYPPASGVLAARRPVHEVSYYNQSGPTALHDPRPCLALISRSAGGRSGPGSPLCRGPLGPWFPALPGAARALDSRSAGGLLRRTKLRTRELRLLTTTHSLGTRQSRLLAACKRAGPMEASA